MLSACGNAPEFSSIAFGKNSGEVNVFESKSKFVDNLFKSKYVYIIKYVEKPKNAWQSSLALTPYNETEDGNPELKKYLINYFPNKKLSETESYFYHLGESLNGREHYLLVFKNQGLAIYYVATI